MLTRSAFVCVAFGSLKKNATAVALAKAGRGLIKVNGVPLELVQPEILRLLQGLRADPAARQGALCSC